MGFYGCIPNFIKRHSGWILTLLGIGGMTASTVLVANEAPKVADEMGSLRLEKWCDDVKAAGHWDDEDPGEYNPPLPELTPAEKFEIAAPHYLPAFLIWLASAACLVGNQIINGKRQAALIAAYGLLSQEFMSYRDDVRGDIGTEREREIYRENHKKIMELNQEIQRLRETNDAQTYMITTLPNVTFDLKPGQLDKALYHFNRNCYIRGGGPLAELYEFIGIPKDAWDEQYDGEAEDYGWESYENEISYGVACVDFVVRQIHLRNEKIINLICPTIPPYKLDLDYGYGASSCDNFYRGGSVEYEDIERWLNSINGLPTVVAEEPDISY